MIDRHETRFALQLLRDQLGQHVYPVHRLDKPTSGVLLFALSPDIAQVLSKQFAERQIHKSYRLVVRGHCPEQGTIDYPLSHQTDKLTDKNKKQDKPAQPAITRYKRLATIEIPVSVDRYPCSRYSLVEAYPETGRKHQIRRHFKHIAHPIIGDAKHGKGKHNRFFQQHYNCHRLLLACTGMEIEHPIHQKKLLLKAELEDNFKALLAQFNWPTD